MARPYVIGVFETILFVCFFGVAFFVQSGVIKATLLCVFIGVLFVLNFGKYFIHFNKFMDDKSYVVQQVIFLLLLIASVIIAVIELNQNTIRL